MLVEIERKFLVVGDYKAHATSHTYIAQGYLCADGGRTVRVRVRDDRGYLTIKGPSNDGGLSRFEWEKEISADEARLLLPLCLPGVVERCAGSSRSAGSPMRSTSFSVSMRD